MNDISDTRSPFSNEAVLRGLAIVGFIALVSLGIWLAIYSARYVPATVGRLGAAAVALTSIFRPGDASLVVIPNNTGTTTPPLENDVDVATSTGSTDAPSNNNVTPSPGPATSGTYPIGGGSSAPLTPSGLPDFITSVLAVGYLASSTTDSFVATSTVPSRGRAAVKFVIKNVGTNLAPAGWRFSASIPTQNAYIFQSPPQQGLNPGDSIEYILGFDQASPGNSQTVSITANFDRLANESNQNNNSASTNLTILGS